MGDLLASLLQSICFIVSHTGEFCKVCFEVCVCLLNRVLSMLFETV